MMVWLWSWRWFRSVIVLLLSVNWSTGDSCDQRYTSTNANEGSFMSPEYPKPYQPHIHCRYMFEGTPDERIKIEFEDLDLEEQFQSKGCLYDYIDIFTIDSENGKHFESRLCGDKAPEPMISTHQTVELVFKSDYKPAEHRGFKGKYKFIDERWLPFPDSPEECGTEYITGVGGVITSPGWPEPYPGYLECTWMIRVEHGRKIILNFLELDLGQSGLIKFFVIGAGVGGPLLVIAVIAVIVVYCKRRLARTKQQEREQMDLAGRVLPPKNNQINGSPYKTTPLPSYSVNAVSPDPSPHSHIYSPSPVKTLNLQSRSSPATPRGPRYAGRSHPATYQMVTSSDTEDPYSVTV